MSPKELNYIEDALGHEQFLMNQCQEAIQNLQDPALKNEVQQMEQKHQQIFDSFYNLVEGGSREWTTSVLWRTFF